MIAPVIDEEIVIENVGPIEQLRIPLPKGGGVVVLTGDNGSGKSESLSAIRALAGSAADKKDLRPRDGEKSGLVEGCGVTIKVGRANRESGELAVSSLEDRIDITQLVDPEILDLNAADARRLKSLIRVSGVKADLSLFESLLGPTIEMETKIIKETDLVTMAAGVKRTLEAKARNEEIAAEASGTEAALCLKSVEGIDLDAESDEATLEADYRAAVKAQADIEQQVKACKAATSASLTAQIAIERAKANYTGPLLADALVERDAADALKAEQVIKVRQLEADLIAARSELRLLQEKESVKQAAVDLATQHESTITAWQQQLELSIPDMPSTEDIAEAESNVKAAGVAMQRGESIRNAKAKQTESIEWTKKKRTREKQAEHWREAAKSVDAVLSDVVANLGCPITVGEDDKGMRLMINHQRRGLTFFSELSEGEKWKVVIPLAAKLVGPGGLFVIPQEAWEGLQPRVQAQIIADLQGTNVTAITAQSADGAIHAEVAA